MSYQVGDRSECEGLADLVPAEVAAFVELGEVVHCCLVRRAMRLLVAGNRVGRVWKFECVFEDRELPVIEAASWSEDLFHPFQLFPLPLDIFF